VLEGVGLDPKVVGRLYPHELSGGMKQRVCIAIGVCLGPDLIIADEPTSALDVITQRHVMQTLREVQEEIGAGLILIGHDMGLMAQSVDDLAVLKLGDLVEFGPVRQILESPQHPYTRELISSVPLVGGESFIDPAAAVPKGFTTEDGTPLLELKKRRQEIRRGAGAPPDELQARRGGAQDHLHRRPVGLGQIHDGQPHAGLQPAVHG
jgi:peptide/nickel transport system ATP-binding protein